MDKIRTGVVGIGFIGAAHIEALRRLINVEVVAIADDNNVTDKADKLGIPKYFEDYRKMIDSCDLDCVHICTPNDMHMDISFYAFEHGVHVVCEKPMARNAEEARAMLEAAEKSGVIHAINYHNRYYPATHHLRNIIKDGELGRIYSIHGGYLQDWLLYDTDFHWKVISKHAGKTRAVADIGSHWIDLAEYVIGQHVTEVFAEFKTVLPTRKQIISDSYEEIDIDTEDFAYIILRFSDGAIGNAAISNVFSGKKNQTTLLVSGSKMAAEWDNEKLSDLYIGCRNEPNRIVTKDTKLMHSDTAPIISYPSGHMEGFPDAFKQNFTAIYDAIRGKKSYGKYATFADGLHQMEICDKLFESANTGAWVKLK